jgi:hypothetical protein
MSACSRCGAGFACGMTDDGARNEPCWCMQLPILPLEAFLAVGGDAAESCLCPACLHALVAAQPKAPGSNN